MDLDFVEKETSGGLEKVYQFYVDKNGYQTGSVHDAGEDAIATMKIWRVLRGLVVDCA